MADGWELLDWSLTDWSLMVDIPVADALGCSTMELDAASASMTLTAASATMAIATCE